MNLLSVSKLNVNENISISFTKGCAIISNKVTLMNLGLVEENGLYLLQKQVSRSVFAGTISLSVWHNRLGHTSYAQMKHILSVLNYFNTSIVDFHCDVCYSTKRTKLPFPKSASKSESHFDLLHLDVWGGFSSSIHDGKRYFMIVVDDHSRFTKVYLLSCKYKCFTLFINLYPKAGAGPASNRSSFILLLDRPHSHPSQIPPSWTEGTCLTHSQERVLVTKAPDVIKNGPRSFSNGDLALIYPRSRTGVCIIICHKLKRR